MAAGKSTAAAALARRFPRSVHVRGDTFRRFIVNGRAEMSLDPSPDAVAQLRLRYELAAHAADRYAASGFLVVLQDIVLGPELDLMIRRVAGRPLHVVVLAPSVPVIRRREAGRGKQGYTTITPEDLDRGFRRDTPRRGLWLDTTRLNVEETVDQILGRPAETRIR